MFLKLLLDFCNCCERRNSTNRFITPLRSSSISGMVSGRAEYVYNIVQYLLLYKGSHMPSQEAHFLFRHVSTSFSMNLEIDEVKADLKFMNLNIHEQSSLIFLIRIRFNIWEYPMPKIKDVPAAPSLDLRWLSPFLQ